MKKQLAFSLLAAAVGMLSGCASDFGMAPRVDLLGDPAPVTAATQVIVLAPDTTYVNVVGGQIVRFQLGDKAFAWNFDGPIEVDQFDLSRVAPPGFLDHKLMAYVAPNPMYSGGGRHGSRR